MMPLCLSNNHKTSPQFKKRKHSQNPLFCHAVLELEVENNYAEYNRQY